MVAEYSVVEKLEDVLDLQDDVLNLGPDHGCVVGSHCVQHLCSGCKPLIQPSGVLGWILRVHTRLRGCDGIGGLLLHCNGLYKRSRAGLGCGVWCLEFRLWGLVLRAWSFDGGVWLKVLLGGSGELSKYKSNLYTTFPLTLNPKP